MLRTTLLSLLVILGLAACTATRPRVQVLGVSDTAAGASHRLLLLLEVHNPTDQELELSGLEYRFVAKTWLDTSGVVPLKRHVGPRASAVVEIPVPLDRRKSAPADSLDYRLEGKLRARTGNDEVGWRVAAAGKMRLEAKGLEAKGLEAKGSTSQVIIAPAGGTTWVAQ